MTGSYHNYFRIFDVESPNDVVLQADKSAFKQKKIGMQNRQRPLREQMNTDALDFNKKILHGSWHPRENTIAVSPECQRPRISFSDVVNSLDRSHEQSLLVQRSIVNGPCAVISLPNCPIILSHRSPR